MWYRITLSGKDKRTLQRELGETYGIKAVRIMSDPEHITIEYQTDNTARNYKQHYFVAVGKRKGYPKGTKATFQYYLEGHGSMCGFGCSYWNYKDEQQGHRNHPYCSDNAYNILRYDIHSIII